ncbi:MAG: hypothetical protein MHMPM18_003960 [Marteilia pararefringens]
MDDCGKTSVVSSFSTNKDFNCSSSSFDNSRDKISKASPLFFSLIYPEFLLSLINAICIGCEVIL